MNRSLRLRRETLTDLTPADLLGVAGAAPKTLPLGDCLFPPSQWYATCTCCTASHSCE